MFFKLMRILFSDLNVLRNNNLIVHISRQLKLIFMLMLMLKVKLI